MENIKLYELTNPQKSIWSTEQFYQGTAINNICGSAIINDIVDYDILKKSIIKVINSNDIFKIKFLIKNNTLKQYISNDVNTIIKTLNVKNYEELENHRKEIASKPFDFFDSYLYNFYIFKMPQNQGGFMLNIHHILADSWTLGFISKQIIEKYNQLKNNTLNSFTPSYTYEEYIQNEEKYFEGERFKKDKMYWEDLFKDIPEIASLSNKQITPQNNTFEGNRIIKEIPKINVKKLKNYCRKKNISLYNFFMAIFAIYISEISNLDDFVIGTPILNRTNSKEKHTSGMFVSTQPFRINLEGVLDFDTLLSNISLNSLKILRHQKYSYQSLLEELRNNNKNMPNLYNILFSYQITNAQNSDEKIDYSTEWTFNGYCPNELEIQIYDINNTGNLSIAYDYRKCIFNNQDIEELHKRILYIIKQILSSDNIQLNDIKIVTPEEQIKLVYDFNQTTIKYNKNKPIIKFFEEQVKLYPKKTALVFKNATMTYESLNEKANSLAHVLREKGVKNNTIVGILENRSFEMIIAILAVLKSGGSYIPIAPEYPDSRIKYMLENSKANVLLTEKLLEKKVNFNGEIIHIGLNNSKIYDFNKENLKNISKPDDLSYVIYTSGSTGEPKGVMLTQKNLTNFYHAMLKNVKYLNYKKASKIISITTLSFDIFIFETLISLTRGLQLYITDYYEQKITSKLERLIKDNKIEILQTTPSIMNYHLDNLLNPQNLSSLKYIILAGEQLPKKLVDRIKQITPKCTIYNGYGPSETTIFSTMANVTNVDTITIGKPIANTQVYILNKNKKLLPKNYMGEIYISGDGVGNGYLYKDQLTKQKYINNPYNEKLKLYETGDLGIWKNNGTLECRGRRDNQIKINGLRIELGEIEECINKFKNDHLLKSAVIIKEIDGKKSLNAFLSYPKNNINIEKLKKHLLNTLPSYMIPNTFTFLESLPFTPNGKIDRKALLKEKIDFSYQNTTVSGPRNEIEEILLNTFKKKLNVCEFGIDSNVFDYGADSLTIINIITELFNYNFNLKVFDLYKYPTIRALYDNMLQNDSIKSTNDYNKFNKINEIVSNFSKDTNSHPIKSKYNILFTGSTGFLGSHLLSTILDDPNKIGKVYCTMRPKKNITPRDRLLEKIHFYFGNKYDKTFDKHIEIIECDLSKKYFGLSINKFNKLQKEIDIVIHSAANVKHYGKYSSFEKTNITGTKHIVEFCTKNKIPLHHISTMTVSGNYLLKQNYTKKSFNENSFYINQNYDQNVYSKSKLLAESLIIEAISNGLPATIYRVGDLTGRYSDGLFQENINENALYLRLKSILEIGYISETVLKNPLEFSPVDYAALAIKNIIWSDKNKNRIFNIYNSNLISTEQILSFMENNNSSITILNKNDFSKLIDELSKNEEEQQKLIGIINDFTADKDLVYNYTIKQKNTITCKYLKNLGFKWPKINNEYLTKLLNYMKKVNFIK